MYLMLIEDMYPFSFFLQDADLDANHGLGHVSITTDPMKAKKFATLQELEDFYKTQSKILPIRSDGKPNRPLTSFSIGGVLLEDVLATIESNALQRVAESKIFNEV